MQDRCFVFGLKYDQIVELLEKLGFEVCENEWNEEIKDSVNNEFNRITNMPFIVKLGKANIEVPQEVNKEQPFKLLVTNYYLKPIWSSKLIATDWGKLVREIYGEDYDKSYLEYYGETRQSILKQIENDERCGYTAAVDKRKSRLKEIENIIAEYEEFLLQVATNQRETEELCK